MGLGLRAGDVDGNDNGGGGGGQDDSPMKVEPSAGRGAPNIQHIHGSLFAAHIGKLV